ncbi:acyl-coenzyme A thioesterase 13-like [Sycon ciliatum]|uniref:acyl-coenzyme A thioesterase 13-like n=1 Tax=Sycon ciliatum TaxID=27933 RepID=UPI0020ACEC6A|eukprot:scpid84370/ scgid32642/ Acyl-coenzyme A thioesterase 13; Thioesterase superfamily member 2
MAKIGLEAAQNLFRMIVEGTHFDRVLRKATIVALSPSKCTCEMTVEEEHANKHGTLHGGMASTLVDTVSTVAIMASDRSAAGVSTDLSVSFVRAAKIGERIRIDAECLKAGRSLAYANVTISRCSDDAILCTGKHTKFFTEK